MITEVILPQLGDTMNEGTITAWYKREGDAVKKGEPLFEVLTDKANVEVEATASGFLRAVTRRENETVPTGEVIAYLTTTAEEPLDVSAGDGGGRSRTTEVRTGEGISEAVPEQEAKLPLPVGERRFISPRAKRLAQEESVDLAQIIASSLSGRVVEADVLKFIAQRQPAPTVPSVPLVPFVAVPEGKKPVQPEVDERVIPLIGIRKIIAERMAVSAREVAAVTLTTEADATGLAELRTDINTRLTDRKFSYTEFIVMLVAKALLKFPYMNATLRDDGIHQHRAVHLGVAVDTERGLLVPVIRNAEKKGLGEISRELGELGENARNGKISVDDLRGGTFTITNLGQYEIDAFTPIVNQPETAILGIGRIVQKPAAFQGQLALRFMLALSLTFDHRVVDGAPAARFLQEVKGLVETPGLVLV